MRKSLVFVAALLVLVLVACQGGAANVDDLLKSGRAHLEADEYNEAITDLKAAVEADPDNSKAHFLLGQAYNQTGDLMKAADEFRTVLELDPDNAAAHHNLGVTYFQLQDPRAAVTELGATYLVLALSGTDPTAPPDPQLLEQATTEFKAALELKENMPEALIGMGNVYIQQGEYATAIEILQQAIEQVPDSPEAYYALGTAYAQSGDVENACEAYSHFLALNPPANWRIQGEQAMTTLGCP